MRLADTGAPAGELPAEELGAPLASAEVLDMGALLDPAPPSDPPGLPEGAWLLDSTALLEMTAAALAREPLDPVLLLPHAANVTQVNASTAAMLPRRRVEVRPAIDRCHMLTIRSTVPGSAREKEKDR